MSKHGKKNKEIMGVVKHEFDFFFPSRATSMAELCTAYFFIGHRGSLTKEDIRSAYDVSKTCFLNIYIKKKKKNNY